MAGSPTRPDLTGLSDEDLVKRIQALLKNHKGPKRPGASKNPLIDAHFQEIYTRYQKKIEYYCSRFVYDRDALTDNYHDIFLKIYLNLHRYHYTKSFKAWIYKIAHNSCINYVRKTRHQDLTVLNRQVAGKDNQAREFIELCESGEIDIEDQLVRKELRDAIESSVDALPFQHRNVYMLKTVAHLTFEEIAKIEKISSRSVKTLFHNSLVFIKERLDQQSFNLGDLKIKREEP
jgi:RNA polymerase sigma-70 factor (ECF subfamily)